MARKIELQSLADFDHLVDASRVASKQSDPQVQQRVDAFVDDVFATVKQNVAINHDHPGRRSMSFNS